MKNCIIAFLTLVLGVFILHYIGLIENASLVNRDYRNQHVAKRIQANLKNPVIKIGSVYSHLDMPALESVKGATLAAELLKQQGKNIEYVCIPDCYKHPEIMAGVQKLCSDYHVRAMLGPGNSENLLSVRALTQFQALPLISAVTVRPDKLPKLEKDNYVSFFPAIEKWVSAILSDMQKKGIKNILIICPEEGTYGEIFSSALEREVKFFLGDAKIYRMNYQQPLYAYNFSNTLQNYAGQHQVDAIFFGGIAEELEEFSLVLEANHFDLPIYVSDEISVENLRQAKNLSQHVFLPEAQVPISNEQWHDLFVQRYGTEPGYFAILGAETMFALAEELSQGTYSPDRLVETMKKRSEELNRKIKITIFDFLPKKM